MAAEIQSRFHEAVLGASLNQTFVVRVCRRTDIMQTAAGFNLTKCLLMQRGPTESLGESMATVLTSTRGNDKHEVEMRNSAYSRFSQPLQKEVVPTLASTRIRHRDHGGTKTVCSQIPTTSEPLSSRKTAAPNIEKICSVQTILQSKLFQSSTLEIGATAVALSFASRHVELEPPTSHVLQAFRS